VALKIMVFFYPDLKKSKKIIPELFSLINNQELKAGIFMNFNESNY
jgi:hypothetical protein